MKHFLYISRIKYLITRFIYFFVFESLQKHEFYHCWEKYFYGCCYIYNIIQFNIFFYVQAVSIKDVVFFCIWVITLWFLDYGVTSWLLLNIHYLQLLCELLCTRQNNLSPKKTSTVAKSMIFSPLVCGLFLLPFQS